MTETDLLATAYLYLRKWQPRVRLCHYDARIVVTTEDEAPASYSVPPYDQQLLIRLRPDCCASLRESYPVLAEWSDDDLVEMAVVHELCHVVVTPEWTEMNRHLDWLTGKRDEAGYFADLHSARMDLDEAIARRFSRILIAADRSGGWARG